MKKGLLKNLRYLAKWQSINIQHFHKMARMINHKSIGARILWSVEDAIGGTQPIAQSKHSQNGFNSNHTFRQYM